MVLSMVQWMYINKCTSISSGFQIEHLMTPNAGILFSVKQCLWLKVCKLVEINVAFGEARVQGKA